MKVTVPLGATEVNLLVVGGLENPRYQATAKALRRRDLGERPVAQAEREPAQAHQSSGKLVRIVE